MKKDQYIKKCEFNSKGLEYTSNFYQIIYFLGVFSPIVLSIIQLGFYPNSTFLQVLTLCLSLLPFMIFYNIPRIDNYDNLSMKFDKLKDTIGKDKTNNFESEYQKLLEELSKYKINFLVKYFLNKKYK